MPALSFKFNNTDPISGHELDDSAQFISSVCWRVNVQDSDSTKLHEKSKNFGPWLHAQTAPKHTSRREDIGVLKTGATAKIPSNNGSRFTVLNDEEQKGSRATAVQNPNSLFTGHARIS
ncbi:unnamed protein product [Dovyalis caffra]|uniref:Uncharacterized protein n=1 Tax=Dovyalis caffra TaxID=77055 RepID=A0AAV1R458_9ROSI|nr:unnamed protein product [Dovyalis caffra]